AEEQEVAGAGANLPGGSGAPGRARRPLRGVPAELDSRRRDELAAVSVDPRGARAGVLDLLGAEPVPRYRIGGSLCRVRGGARARGVGSDFGGAEPDEERAGG